MNLHPYRNAFRNHAFRLLRRLAAFFPGGTIGAFGLGRDRVGSIVVINLDRQPERWERVRAELGRFRTSDGRSLTAITRRFAAIDARDGKAVAATADVDPVYRLGDQLHVQPDRTLEACFGADEQLRMTRQEVAIARSHIEVWKSIVLGQDERVLVLEDDVWFSGGAATAITNGWHEALERSRPGEGPHLFYLSYEDAGGTAERTDIGPELFRPVRGLWFMSGYILSREGASRLLRAMPVVGPVDTWMNYRFAELDALAIASPVILQRPDATSQNSYSVLPYLARAGVVDAGSGLLPAEKAQQVKLVAWAEPREHEGLAMALSMLGLRVRVFEMEEGPVDPTDLDHLFDRFEALIDPPLAESTLIGLLERPDVRLIMECASRPALEAQLKALPKSRITILPEGLADWPPLCALLEIPEPTEPFPKGADRCARLFREPRSEPKQTASSEIPLKSMDASPWIAPWHRWQRPLENRTPLEARHFRRGVDTTAIAIAPLSETFPGNLAAFCVEGLSQNGGSTRLTLTETPTATRDYQSGAFASVQSFRYGHFEARIKAAQGAGLVTGFFLHRSSPRQEIDVELTGANPGRMIANVYFNPGDEGSTLEFGYRGTPCHIDLGFDATEDVHLYAIDWNADRIIWSVDGEIVHERKSWGPTPIPHLPMRLHGNLWAPRSVQLAGDVKLAQLPSSADFANVSFSTAADEHEARERDLSAQMPALRLMPLEARSMAGVGMNLGD